jgi:hypothetical protein
MQEPSVAEGSATEGSAAEPTTFTTEQWERQQFLDAPETKNLLDRHLIQLQQKEEENGILDVLLASGRRFQISFTGGEIRQWNAQEKVWMNGIKYRHVGEILAQISCYVRADSQKITLEFAWSKTEIKNFAVKIDAGFVDWKQKPKKFPGCRANACTLLKHATKWQRRLEHHLCTNDNEEWKEFNVENRGICQHIHQLVSECIPIPGICQLIIRGYLEASPPPFYVGFVRTPNNHQWLLIDVAPTTALVEQEMEAFLDRNCSNNRQDQSAYVFAHGHFRPRLVQQEQIVEDVHEFVFDFF